MKKYYFLILYFTIPFVFAQEGVSETSRIAESEMKSASQVMNFQVNPNTANYDVTYSKLEFTLNPAVYAITGKVTTTFKALSDMTTVTFDLTNELTVSSVKQGMTNLSFVQNANEELVITLPTTLTTNSFATVEINYSGAPATGEQAFTRSTHAGASIIWTLSEPFGARDWWPCKQDLNDKIDSIDVYITAPSQYVSVANGVEPEAPVINGANKTTHFHHSYPIPAYLVAIAVTNYQVFTQTAGTAPNTFPIVNYIYPEDYSSAVVSLAETLPIMDIFEDLFETYPFHAEKYGHAQFGWGGGMEHTTVSFMGGFSRGLIAHELAHQWFGDKITCGTWKDIWLNEGFATYLAALAIENLDGLNAFITQKSSMIDFITSSPAGNVYLTDAQATNVGRIFSSRLSYNKGAMVLEMLRFKMGDTNFFQAVRNYLADPNLAFKYAVTTDLKAHLEAVYGQDLTEFFQDWIYNQGYPTYTITAQNWGTGQAKFVVNQTQSDASVTYFEMPVPVRIYGAGGQQADLVLNNTVNGEQFIMSVPFEITGVAFDPEKHIISANSTATLGNQDFSMDNAVVLYPNPSADILHIQMPSSLVLEKATVYNSLGQKVLENNTVDFSVSQLSSGVHYIDIQTTTGTYHKKFIKK
ncbi:T9SS type A sorting domain-containing protein [Flavobacterium sp. J49]|uniref:M1 family aminopeptidase n=1 Tax=Flavobacterium sp. J49 TaxID=2718534 RepID=UPI001594CB14|nr:M1 family aminopeptidase [Flavobacterium sp. J49]MBF6641663.1 T9SS type A sorting domain-containing protein [Flavobacterium sp. J49]NIC02910.1 T9SS type A sorting domain-containing protein [Flavobacterium sp. J49]